ncbi:hypothetical protein BS17DRAFT_883582 [Gyrodon lividus]|nr:hypothetical protein BS17DRAFT_883582 [Gyrodon lividus]
MRAMIQWPSLFRRNFQLPRGKVVSLPCSDGYWHFSIERPHPIAPEKPPFETIAGSLASWLSH